MTQTRKLIEVALRLEAINIERKLGFEPTDRELEKLGYDIESRTHYVRQPFHREPDFGVTSVNYDFAELFAQPNASM